MFIVCLLLSCSYDMVHYGHSNQLRQAKAMGDHLIAGVHTDGPNLNITLFMTAVKNCLLAAYDSLDFAISN